jgi:site-specific recombinase
VWLWAASLLAGGVENWFIVRELPGALASSRVLRRLVGPTRALEISQHARVQVSGLGGNLGLGLLLGFMPMIFSLFGLPLQVRHVTFVTGQLAFAVMEKGWQSLAEPPVLQALVSIPLVGLINFAVSFFLALVVALRARGLGLRWLLRLSRAVGVRLLRSPKEFLLAPKSEPTGVPAA